LKTTCRARINGSITSSPVLPWDTSHFIERLWMEMRRERGFNSHQTHQDDFPLINFFCPFNSLVLIELD